MADNNQPDTLGNLSQDLSPRICFNKYCHYCHNEEMLFTHDVWDSKHGR